MSKKTKRALKPISKYAGTERNKKIVISLPKKYTERAVEILDETHNAVFSQPVEVEVPVSPSSGVHPNYGKGIVPGILSVRVKKEGKKYYFESVDKKYRYLKIFPIDRQDDVASAYRNEPDKIFGIKVYGAEQGIDRKLKVGETINCEGKIVKSIESESPFMRRVMSISYDHGVSMEPDQEDMGRVLHEYGKFHDVSENDPDDPLSIEKVKARFSNFLDARHLPFVVIDPGSEDKNDTKNRSGDHDDATYTEKHADGSFTQYTAIAATALYVTKGSEIEKLAWKRMISYYIFNRVAPLFLPRLSTDLCSFNEGENRFAVITIQQFDKNKKPKLDENGNEIFEIRLGVIRPSSATVYSIIDKVFAGDEEAMAQFSEGELKSLFALKELNEALSAQRLENGEARFRTREWKYILNADESGVERVIVEGETESHQAVATTMLESNRVNAIFGLVNDITMIKRNEPRVNFIKLQQMREFCKNRGLHFEYDEENARPGDLQRAISKVIEEARQQKTEEEGQQKGELYAQVVSEFLIPRVERAYYDTENIGHWALFLQIYIHESAGIRRFVDMVNQANSLAKMEGKPEPYSEEEMKELSDLANFAERNSDALAAQLNALGHVYEIGKRLAQGEDLTCQGYISKVEPGRFTVLTENGRFVVDLSEPDGTSEFKLSLDHMSIRNGSKVYSVGQEIEIRPTKANYEDCTVEAEITNTLEESQAHGNYMESVNDFYKGGGYGK